MYWLVGSQGMLGCEVRSFLERQEVPFLATDREVDITDLESLFAFISPRRISVIINCAAFTDVRACEVETELAFQVNAEGVRNLSKVAAWKGARLVHISTDYVFNGRAREPYREDAATDPINAYGQSKLAGERYLRASSCPWVLVRTSWLFGRGGRNFVTTVLDRLRAQGVIRVVDDQYGSPTYAPDLAQAIFGLSRAQTGIYHVTNEGVTTWFEFACEIARLGSELGLLPRDVRVEPISSADLRDPVARPSYSALDTSRAKAALGRGLRPWREALSEFLSQLRKAPVGP